MLKRIQPAPGIKRVPFPGGGQYLRTPRRVEMTPYWERYLDQGVVVEVDPPTVAPQPIAIGEIEE